MEYPKYYDQVKMIRLYDPLSHFLGAMKEGVVDINYLDCVKLAGHSCPTVAGAYLMALKGLALLYPDSLPQRGFIRVDMREDENEGVTGVICNVISFIMGAGGKGGFKGIQGNFSRNDLIGYHAPIQGDVKLTRIDTNQSVSLSYNPSIIPSDTRMMPLMKQIMDQSATHDEEQLFKHLWQKRVKTILLSEELWDQMVTVN